MSGWITQPFLPGRVTAVLIPQPTALKLDVPRLQTDWLCVKTLETEARRRHRRDMAAQMSTPASCSENIQCVCVLMQDRRHPFSKHVGGPGPLEMCARGSEWARQVMSEFNPGISNNQWGQETRAKISLVNSTFTVILLVNDSSRFLVKRLFICHQRSISSSRGQDNYSVLSLCSEELAEFVCCWWEWKDREEGGGGVTAELYGLLMALTWSNGASLITNVIYDLPLKPTRQAQTWRYLSQLLEGKLLEDDMCSWSTEILL